MITVYHTTHLNIIENTMYTIQLMYFVAYIFGRVITKRVSVKGSCFRYLFGSSGPTLNNWLIILDFRFSRSTRNTFTKLGSINMPTCSVPAW